MNPKSALEDDDGSKRAAASFRDGACRAYARLVWAWVDTKRGATKRAAFARSQLRMDPSVFNHGLGDGKLTLESLLLILVQLTCQPSQLPDIPEKKLLALFGYHRAATPKSNAHVDTQFVLAYAVHFSRAWVDLATLSINGQSKRETTGSIGPGPQLLVRLDLEIKQRTHALLEKLREYYEMLPDDNAVTLDSAPDDREAYYSSWLLHGASIRSAINAITQYDWCSGAAT